MKIFDVLGRDNKKPDTRSRDQKIQDALAAQSKGGSPYAESRASTSVSNQKKNQAKPAEMDPRIAERRKQVKDEKNFGPESTAKRKDNAAANRAFREKLYRDLHGDEAYGHMQEAKRRHTARPEVGSLNMMQHEDVPHNDTRYTVWDNGRSESGHHYFSVSGAGTEHFVRTPEGKLHHIPEEVHIGHTFGTSNDQYGAIDKDVSTQRYLQEHHEAKDYKIPHATQALTSSKTYQKASVPAQAPVAGKPALKVVKSSMQKTLCKREKAWVDGLKKAIKWPKTSSGKPMKMYYKDFNRETADWSPEDHWEAHQQHLGRYMDPKQFSSPDHKWEIARAFNHYTAARSKVGIPSTHLEASRMNGIKYDEGHDEFLQAMGARKTDGLQKARVDENMSDKAKRQARDERRKEAWDSRKAINQTAANTDPNKGISRAGASLRAGYTSTAKLAHRARLSRLQNMKKPDLGKAEGLEKGKNKREQRAKVFGTDANAPRTSEKRMKMMQILRRFTKDRHNLDMVTASGKRDPNTGELKSKKPIEQEPYDVFTPQGVEAEKQRQDKIAEINSKRTAEGKKPIKRYDPKPDWRSGDMETQPSPDAAVHELAHFYHEPEGQSLEDMQTRMDVSWGDSQKKYGHMQQKKTEGEIQPMALENKIRRRLGIPANRSYKNAAPMSEHDRPVEQAIDGTGARFVRGQAPGKDGPKSVDYDRQSRLLAPQHAERLDQIDRGELVFDKQKGWVPGTSVNSKINQRAREKSNDMTRKDFETLQRNETCRYGNTLHKSEGGCWYCGKLKTWKKD